MAATVNDDVAAPEPTDTLSPLRAAVRATIRRPTVIVSLVWLVMLAVATSIPSVFSPHDPQQQNLRGIYELPSSTHLLGTDNLGRDILSRLIHGGGGALQGAVLAVAVSLLIGVTIGLLAGYFGGRIDNAVVFYTNVLLSLPGFIIIVTVSFVTDNNITLVMIALGVVFSGAMGRLVRGSTQATRNLLYVDSARVSGMSTSRILTRHIFPNITGPLIVQTFLFLSQAFIIYASLSFLGLGFDPQSADWGQLVLQATRAISRHPWLMIPIGVALILTVLAFNQLGTALRGALPQAQRQSMLVAQHPRLPSPPINIPVRGEHLESDVATIADNDDDTPVVAASGLTVSFPGLHGEVAVVDNVSLQVGRGEVLGLVGESGCGKSMTALALLGLVPAPGAVTAESLVVSGAQMGTLAERERALLRGRTIAMIGQEPMVALDPCFSIGSALVEALRVNRGSTKTVARAEARDLLGTVGIARVDDVYASYPHQLSGGMAQRVAIALALTGQPEILIADEPTTALDPTIQAEILDLLHDLREAQGMAILLVTHDLGVVADLCERVDVMYAGQIIESGTVAAVFDHPSHPYTQGLLSAVPKVSAESERLSVIPGRVPLPRDWPVGCRFAERCPIAEPSCAEGPISNESVDDGHLTRCRLAGDTSGGIVVKP